MNRRRKKKTPACNIARRHLGAARRERGVALIMVLGAIAVLTVLLAEFQTETTTDISAATVDRDSVQAEYMARSAVNLSRLLIAGEPTVRQSIMPLFMLMKKSPPQIPLWEYSDQLLGVFNDQEAAKGFAGTVGIDLSLGKNLGLPGGRFEITIVDEDAKINVNQAFSNEIARIRLAKEIMGLIAPVQFSPLFEQRDANGQFHTRLETCGAIVDWGDPDEQAFNCDTTNASASGTGPEDAYYNLLPVPYKRKNAPYDSLDELHMVRGVSEDFWATFVDPDPTNPKKRVMTVWGQGTVNVNTANAQTLYAIVCANAPDAEICTDPAQAATFITGVTMAQGVTMGAPLFGNAQQFVNTMKGEGDLGKMLSAFGVKPVKFKSDQLVAQSVTTESKIFSIYARGFVSGYKRETRTGIHAVVDFRQAPGLSSPSSSSTSTSATTPPPAGSASAAKPATSPTDPNSIAAAMAPNTGGQIVYFRIE
jgi:general secretion pathway protein K